MNKMKRTGISVLGLALVISLIPVASYAQTATEEPVNSEGCIMAKARIATHATAVTTLQTERTAKYATIKSKVDTFVSSATEANYTDIAKLTAARDTVTTAISDYATQAKVYATTLEKAQAAPCGEGTGEFISALAIARAELKTLRTDGLAVKTAAKQNAVPALREYATWLKANATKESL